MQFVNGGSTKNDSGGVSTPANSTMYLSQSEVVQKLGAADSIAVIFDKNTRIRKGKDFDQYLGVAISKKCYDDYKRIGDLEGIKFLYKKYNWQSLHSYIM